MELAEPPQNNKLYQQNSPIIMVMHLMTAAGASAPADAVFRFTAGEAMQTEDDDEDTDRSEEYSDDGRVSDLAGLTHILPLLPPPPPTPQARWSSQM